MNHKIVFTATALLLMSGSAFAQTATCPDGMTTGSCNITEIGDRAHDGSQTVGDTINPTYSPDSASASASTGAIDVDAVGQGGTASSTATGNQSSNSNNSSANNSATNTMTNGAITNDVTGGNITGGSLTQTGSADITNSGGNVTGGTATTNSGNVAGGAGGSVGNVGSASSAVSGASTSTASGGNIAGSGNSRNANNNKTGNQTTNVDASNNSRYEYKEAARSAAPIMLPNVSNSVCDGGGSFGASIQTFGWGVTATRKKGDRFCQMLTIDPTGRAAMAYLGNVDNSVKKALVQNGFAVVHKTEVVRTETTVRALEKATTLACPDTAPNLVQKADGRMVCTNTAPTAPQPTRSESAPPTGTICPAGSSWDGRGCWRPAQ